MLEARSLSKRYGATAAADGVSFCARPGEMLGLLGPNGAGKTTTVSMIAGLLRPDAGEVLLDGRRLEGDTDPLKRSIGLVPQDLALIEELPAIDNLLFFAALYGLDRGAARRAAEEALAFVGLTERCREKVAAFSGGMKRRLNLAAALLHDPTLILLDEPTVGVDPQSRHAIFENLQALKRSGRTLLYTTHYMEEAERLCDRIVVMDHGRVIADDTLAGLYRLMPAPNVVVIELDDGTRPNLRELESVRGVTGCSVSGDALKVAVSSLVPTTAAVLQWLADRGHAYRHVVTERADLETVFLALTGRTLRD